MKTLQLMIGLLVILIAGTVGAEYYKYRDANGVLRFTDNLGEVPIDQREKVKAYQSVPETPPAPAGTPEKAGDQLDIKTNVGAPPDELNAEKIALEKEYEEIMEANRQLKAAVDDIENPPDPAEYNQKVKALDAKVKAYEERRKAFEDKVAAYGAARE